MIGMPIHVCMLVIWHLAHVHEILNTSSANMEGNLWLSIKIFGFIGSGQCIASASSMKQLPVFYLFLISCNTSRLLQMCSMAFLVPLYAAANVSLSLSFYPMQHTYYISAYSFSLTNPWTLSIIGHRLCAVCVVQILGDKQLLSSLFCVNCHVIYVGILWPQVSCFLT